MMLAMYRIHRIARSLLELSPELWGVVAGSHRGVHRNGLEVGGEAVDDCHTEDFVGTAHTENRAERHMVASNDALHYLDDKHRPAGNLAVSCCAWEERPTEDAHG